MKKPRVSLSLRVNLLLVLIILVTFGLLLAISNAYYWETVYTPHIRKLNQAFQELGDLSTEAGDILRFLDSEELERALNARAEEKPEEIVRGMRETLDRFTRGADPFDDVTMMCLKYYGAEGKTGC